MSFEARRYSTAVDLKFGVVLRILKGEETIDPYEEMQKLPGLKILIIFWEDIGEIRVYRHCLDSLCGHSRHRLLNEVMFKLSEDGSFLEAISSKEKTLTIDDALGVYFYINDLVFVQRRKIPRIYMSLN